MKIKLVKPSGDQILIDADFWEFSQGKYDNEDIVLVFYKNEEDVKEEEVNPSKSGVLPIKNLSLQEDLEKVVGNDKINSTRENIGVVFENDEKKLNSKARIQAKMIETSLYNLNDTDIIEKALKELVSKEKELGVLLRQIKKPIILLKNNDNFILKETVGFEIHEK